MSITQPSILVLSGVRGDTQRYRSFHPYEQLRFAGVPCDLSHITDPQLPARFERDQVVILHRVAFDSYVERLVESVINRGGLVIGDVDDLVFDPTAFAWIDSPDFQDPQRTALYQEEMERYRSTLEMCQAVTASTEFLAEQVRKLGRPAWIHRNGFSIELLGYSEAVYPQKAQSSERVVIGYASGTPTHDRDFEVARPAIVKAMARYPQAELQLIGPLNPGEDWNKLAPRIQRLPRVPWQELPGVQVQFDINLAPLVMDNPFAQSKSEIKYMEAALVRVPTIASPTGAFAHAIRPGETGFLAADEDQWYEALSNLIEDKGLRTKISGQAYEDVISRYHPATRAKELITTINKIHENVYRTPLWDVVVMSKLRRNLEKGSSQETVLEPGMMQPPSLARMGLYSLRHRGMRTLFRQARVYLRRVVAPLFPYSPNDQ